MKLVASHLGGTRNPLAIRWPKKVAPDPVPRDHFLHCNESYRPSTTSWASRRRSSSTVCRRSRSPEQVSPARLPNAPRPGGRRPVLRGDGQSGHLSRRLDGLDVRSAGALAAGIPPGIQDWTPDNDRWELYHLDEDWSQAHDLAAEMPDKLAQMREMFAIEAARNSVLPIGGGMWVPIFHPELRIAPPYREWEFSGEITRMPEVCAPALGNRNNTVTVDADLPADASGVLYALGGFAGGVTCYLDDGYLCYEYNCFILSRTKIRSTDQTAARAHHDCRGNPPCRTAARRTARRHHPSRPRRSRQGAGAGQRAAAVHRQRLLRHRHLPGLAGVAELLRKGALPLRRPHRARPRGIYLTHRPARSSCGSRERVSGGGQVAGAHRVVGVEVECAGLLAEAEREARPRSTPIARPSTVTKPTRTNNSAAAMSIGWIVHRWWSPAATGSMFDHRTKLSAQRAPPGCRTALIDIGSKPRPADRRTQRSDSPAHSWMHYDRASSTRTGALVLHSLVPAARPAVRLGPRHPPPSPFSPQLSPSPPPLPRPRLVLPGRVSTPTVCSTFSPTNT